MAAFLVSVPLSGVSLASALGWPLPYWPGVTISAGKHKILGGKIERNVAIYVLFDGEPPRYLWMPYSDKAAQDLQDAMAKGAQGHTGVAATVPPFDYSVKQTAPKFYPLPQPKLPNKFRPPAPMINP